MSLTIGRLIPLHACRGAENMAVDQALLESVDASGRPALRFYTWRLPTLSLGYFQPESERRGHIESRLLDCVRRATGGGAIVHHHELTYSLAIPSSGASAGPRIDLYRQTHQSLVEALHEYGVHASPYRVVSDGGRIGQPNPFLCFQRRTDEDLIVHGYKVVGSAQRKSRNSMLQHGSVLFKASRWAPQLPGVEDLTGCMIPMEEFAMSFARRLGTACWRSTGAVII